MKIRFKDLGLSCNGRFKKNDTEYYCASVRTSISPIYGNECSKKNCPLNIKNEV